MISTPLWAVSTWTTFLTTTEVALAQPTTTPDRFYEDLNPWMPPTEGDVRSPCPFVNTFANHGFIPRDGKNVDLFQMVLDMEEIFDLSSDFVNIVAMNAITNGLTFEDSNGIVRIDIDALFSTASGEDHESSLVRNDQFFGHDFKLVNDTLLNDLLRVNPTSSVLTLDDVMEYQRKRILHSRANNPEAEYTQADIENSAAQALTLFFLGSDDTLQTVEKERVYSMLLLERIPDGYVPGSMRMPTPRDPFNFLNPNDFAMGIFLEFVENIQNALQEDIEFNFDIPCNSSRGRARGIGRGNGCSSSSGSSSGSSESGSSESGSKSRSRKRLV